MTKEDYKLLSDVYKKCNKDPRFINHIINACTSGIVDTEKEMRKQAADMETVAIAMYALLKENRTLPSLKKIMSELALSKLSKYYPKKNFLRWADNVISNKDNTVNSNKE